MNCVFISPLPAPVSPLLPAAQTCRGQFPGHRGTAGAGAHRGRFRAQVPLCCYASRKNVGYVHSHEEILARYGGHVCQVDRVPGVFASALGDMGYIFRTADFERLHEIIRFIHQTSV